MASPQLRRDEQEEVVPKLTTHLESVSVIGDEQQLPGVVQRVVETIHAADAGDQTGIQEEVVHHAANQPGSATVVHKFVGTVYSTGGQTGQQVKGTQLAGPKDSKGAQQISEQMKKNRPPGAPQTTFQKKNGATQKGPNEPTKNNISSASQQSGDQRGSTVTAGAQQTQKSHQTAVNKDVQQTNKNQSGATSTLSGRTRNEAQQTTDQQSKRNMYGKTTVESGGKAVGAVKDAALVAGWGAAELASETTHDSMEAGVAGLAFGLTDTAVKKGATYIGEKIVEGKDIALETGKTTAQYAGKAAGVVKDATFVGGRSAAKLASDTACGVEESMRNLNVGVGELIEDSAIATEIVAGKATGLTLETGKTTADLVGKSAAGVLKDAALAAGRTAVGLATNTAAGLTDSMETINVGVAGLAENTAEKTMGLKDTVVDAGKKGATYIGDRAVAGKDITLETGKTTAKFAAGVVKDAALVGGWSAAELATDTAAGVRESVDNLNLGVAGLVEGTAVGTEAAAQKAIGLADTMVSAGKKGATYIGENVVVGKDVTLETGRTTAEYVGQAAGVVKDAALVAGWKAASDTAEGVTESMGDLNKGVSGLVEGAAVATEATAEKAIGLADSVVDAGKRAAVGSAAAVLKDAALGEGESGVYVGGAGMDFKSHVRGLVP